METQTDRLPGQQQRIGNSHPGATVLQHESANSRDRGLSIRRRVRMHVWPPTPVSSAVRLRSMPSSQLQSMGLALRSLLACESFCDEQRTAYSRVDLITGYRYMQLNDDLLDQRGPQRRWTNSPWYRSTSSISSTRAISSTRFDLGAIWQGGWQRLSLDLTLKTAVGYGRQEVDIQGGTVIAQTATTAAYPGGVLALPSNIGLHSRDRFAVVPELCSPGRVPHHEAHTTHGGLHVHLLGIGCASRRPDRPRHQPRPGAASHHPVGRPTAPRLCVPGIDVLGSRRQRRRRGTLVGAGVGTGTGAAAKGR